MTDNSWLDNQPIATEKEITYSEYRRYGEEQFQAGIDFASKMLAGDVDLEPAGVTRVCFTCHKSEFLTDAEAEKKGWAADACADCIKETDTPTDITKSAYFSRTIGFAENAKLERIGNINVR